MDESGEQQGLLSLTTEIVAAFASNHTVEVSALPTVISSVFLKPYVRPAWSRRQSRWRPSSQRCRSRSRSTSEFIVCLEDGKKLKMLKRHLATRYKMTPAEYRTRWGLPSDYPMVAPAYAAKRSELAKSIGLGRKPVETAPEPEQSGGPEAGPPGGGRSQAAEDSSLNGCPG